MIFGQANFQSLFMMGFSCMQLRMWWQTISRSIHFKGLHPIIGKPIPGDYRLHLTFYFDRMFNCAVPQTAVVGGTRRKVRRGVEVSRVLHLAGKGPVRNEPCTMNFPLYFGAQYVEYKTKYLHTLFLFIKTVSRLACALINLKNPEINSSV